MAHQFKTFGLGILTIALVSSCTTATTNAPNKQFPPIDSSRNVLSFADTLEEVLPSVVRIGSLDENAEGKLALSGIGSGAVIDAEKGYVVTNAHVVSGGKGYLINLPDGRVIKARLVGIDTPTDIAVLQAGDLRVEVVSIANSDSLRVGDVVFAVGYPLGLEQSLSMGVISGLGGLPKETAYKISYKLMLQLIQETPADPCWIAKDALLELIPRLLVYRYGVPIPVIIES